MNTECICGHDFQDHRYEGGCRPCDIIGCGCLDFQDRENDEFTKAILDEYEYAAVTSRKKEYERFIKHAFGQPVDSDSKPTPPSMGPEVV